MEVQSIIHIVLILGILSLVVSIIMRLTRLVITIAVLLIVVPIICTVLWGDGTVYVSSFASVFSPQIEEEINSGYRYYKEQYAEDPTVDMDQLSKYAASAKDKRFESITEDTQQEQRVFPQKK